MLPRLHQASQPGIGQDRDIDSICHPERGALCRTKDPGEPRDGSRSLRPHNRALGSHPFPLYHRLAMLGDRTNEQWVAQYSTSHQHPVNRICHTLGIPLILLSLAVFAAGIFIHRLWPDALALFLVGWAFQFIGHAFERKEPEFFHDWRFLFVGVRWWWAKIHGKA
jgi:hypothetical protein